MLLDFAPRFCIYASTGNGERRKALWRNAHTTRLGWWCGDRCSGRVAGGQELNEPEEGVGIRHGRASLGRDAGVYLGRNDR